MTVTIQNGVSAENLASISTPDRVESRLGTLEFTDGAPTDATAALGAGLAIDTAAELFAR